MVLQKSDWVGKIYAYALENALSHEGKAVVGSVLNPLFKEGLEKKEIKNIIPVIQEIVNKVNSMSTEEQEKENQNYSVYVKKPDKKQKGLPELEGAKKGKVVLRLAPFPSGALHIGNAKTYLLNALYAERYNGKLILVIDDTIGSKEKQIEKQAYKLIPEAFDWLGVKYDKKIIYKSDRLNIYYKYAKELINKSKAYVCSCSREELRKNREMGVECSCRHFPAKENMKKWKEMFSAPVGKMVLRLKTNMQHPNPAFRDRVLFRISDEKHPRVGKKYRVWPLLEFSWAVDDHLLKITHILRGQDLMIETDMEKFIWDIFKWKHPHVIHTGLVRISDLGAKISKSKAQKEVKSGEFTGWDDPRTWSVQSLKARGFLPEAVRKFVEEIGLNKQDIEIPVDSLYAINRRMIDLDADRYSFVESPVKLDIKDMPDIRGIDIKLHPEKDKKKWVEVKKNLYISNTDFKKFKNKEVRLMHLFNTILKRKTKAENSEDKSIPKINWVSDYVKAKVLMPDGKWVEGYAEKTIEKLKKAQVIQFERFGFVKLNNINSKKEYEFWFAHR